MVYTCARHTFQAWDLLLGKALLMLHYTHKQKEKNYSCFWEKHACQLRW